jgi:hypothetical protein
MPHSIRLLGPWQLRVENTELRITVPADLTDFVAPPQTAKLERRFNRPTGLTESDRVHIQMDYTGELLDVECNGTTVEPACNDAGVTSIEVGPLLQPNNHLVFSLRYGAGDSLKLEFCAMVISAGTD